MPADLDTTRVEWERAYRDLEQLARDPAHEGSVRAQLEAITSELRKRVGGTYTLRELAGEYDAADLWAREALADLGVPGWPRTLTLVEGAAFHVYSRGAVDYAP